MRWEEKLAIGWGSLHNNSVAGFIQLYWSLPSHPVQLTSRDLCVGSGPLRLAAHPFTVRVLRCIFEQPPMWRTVSSSISLEP